jgi:hypothetical protein
MSAFISPWKLPLACSENRLRKQPKVELISMCCPLLGTCFSSTLSNHVFLHSTITAYDAACRCKYGARDTAQQIAASSHTVQKACNYRKARHAGSCLCNSDTAQRQPLPVIMDAILKGLGGFGMQLLSMTGKLLPLQCFV